MSGNELEAATGPGVVHTTRSYVPVVQAHPEPDPLGATRPPLLIVTVTSPTASVASSLWTVAVTSTGPPNTAFSLPFSSSERSDSPANALLR